MSVTHTTNEAVPQGTRGVICDEITCLGASRGYIHGGAGQVCACVGDKTQAFAAPEFFNSCVHTAGFDLDTSVSAWSLG